VTWHGAQATWNGGLGTWSEAREGMQPRATLSGRGMVLGAGPGKEDQRGTEADHPEGRGRSGQEEAGLACVR
jgi:hypothetical protein